MEKLITIPLEEVPQDVNKIIKKEQSRLDIEEDKKLKKPHVVFYIIRQWEKLKTNNASGIIN